MVLFSLVIDEIRLLSREDDKDSAFEEDSLKELLSSRIEEDLTLEQEAINRAVIVEMMRNSGAFFIINRLIAF